MDVIIYALGDSSVGINSCLIKVVGLPDLGDEREDTRDNLSACFGDILNEEVFVQFVDETEPSEDK